MALKNINTINESIDFEELASRYNYYALSNLGQRFGVDNSFVKSDSFKLKELCGTVNEENENNLCIRIIYKKTVNESNKEIETINIGPFNYLLNSSGIMTGDISIRDTFNITEKILLNHQIGDVKYYNNGLISYDKENKKYYYCFECYEEDSETIESNKTFLENENFIKFIYEEFDSEKDIFLGALMFSKNIFMVTENIVENGELKVTKKLLPTLTYLNKDENEDNKYYLTFYHINEDLFDDLIKYINTELTNKDKVSIKKLFSHFESNLDVINISDSINENYKSSIELNFNTEKNKLFSCTDNNLNIYKPKFKLNSNEIDFIYTGGLNNILYIYGEELINLYPYMKSYYSNNIFLLKNNTLKTKIVGNLISSIAASLSIEKSEYVFYAPWNYEINYLCKTEDENHIFQSSHDIVVEYFKDDFELDKLKFLSITDDGNYNKIALYKFNILYLEDINNNELPYEINPYCYYVLPYIGEEDYWYINNEKSNIYARGINAGQPNIIFIYNGCKYIEKEKYSNPSLIYCANKETLFNIKNFLNEYNNQLGNNSSENIHWIEKEIKINSISNFENNIINEEDNSELELLTKDDVDNTKLFYKLKTSIIDYNKYSKAAQDELRNSIIINITSVNNCISKSQSALPDLDKIYGINGNITTIWMLNKNSDNNYEYQVLLKDNSDCALDIVLSDSLNELIKWQLNNFEPLHPHNYLYNQLLLNCSYTTSKNQEEDDIDFLNKEMWASIRNIDSTHPLFSNINPSDSYSNQDNYLNNANLVIDYVDYINRNASNEKIIDSIGKNPNSRFFSYELNTFTNYSNTYEYIPNSTSPTLELGEVFVRNANIINRTNIISVSGSDKDINHYYYSYIGTAFDNEDKSKLIIGTAKQNISFGTYTLSYTNDFFKEQKELNINFDKVKINDNLLFGKDNTYYYIDDNQDTFIIEEYISYNKLSSNYNCLKYINQTEENPGYFEFDLSYYVNNKYDSVIREYFDEPENIKFYSSNITLCLDENNHSIVQIKSLIDEYNEFIPFKIELIFNKQNNLIIYKDLSNDLPKWKGLKK